MPYCSSVLVEADVIKITDLLFLGFFAGGQLAQQGEYSETGALYYVSSYAGRCGVESYLNVLRCMGHTTDVWDVSLKATLGVFWTPNLTPQAEYGLGFDATVYPFKHVGFSLGCDWGRYAVSNRTFYNVVEGNFKMNLGLRFRF